MQRPGPDASFDAIDSRYRATLVAYATRCLGSRADAEDIVQEALLATHLALSDERTIDLGPWLVRVVRNRCWNLIRARRREVLGDPTGEFECHAAQPERVVLHRERLRELIEDVRELPERQRTALKLVALEGRSHVAVAEQLAITRVNSRSLVFKARRSLIRAEVARAWVQPKRKVVVSHGASGAAPCDDH